MPRRQKSGKNNPKRRGGAPPVRSKRPCRSLGGFKRGAFSHVREGPPFESPKRTAGAFRSHGRGPAPPFWIILPALLTARHCCARTQSAARLPSLAPHGVRRGCWMNRLAGTRGEATYTALTLRSACSHSSCKLPMLGVEGDSPRVLLGVQGGYSLTRENIPLIS